MAQRAASLSVKAQSPERVARAVGEAIAKVGSPSAALCFVSGSLADQLGTVAEAVAGVARGVPVVVVSGAGVLTEQGELEDQAAAAVLAFRGGQAESITAEGSTADELSESLARSLSDRTAKTDPTMITFVRAEGFGPLALEPLRDARGTRHVFGAGAVGHPGVIGIDAAGRLSTGGAVALLLRGIAPPRIRTSPACRLLGPLRRITETRGSMVVRLDDEPALDVLGSVGQELADQPLVFAVLADGPESATTEGGRPELVVRGLQGVDPVRRGLLVSEEIKEGMRMTFGIKDGGTARTDLETVTRELQRDIAGAAPLFGLYLNCAGRGSGLYGAIDVDTRILRSRFGATPFAGMMSAFEIAPHGGRPTLHLYTGVIALFTEAS